MLVKASNLFAASCLLAFCGVASAYTISGTVSDDQGQALQGASVSLLKEGKTATTDGSGKIHHSRRRGYSSNRLGEQTRLPQHQ